MPVDRIARQFQVLAHAVELHALDIHLAGHHGHDVATEVGLCRIFRRLHFDVAGQQAHFAALIHLESDLAKVHVVQFFIERNGVAADGSNAAALSLARIKVGRREHNLVTHFPLLSVQHLDRGSAGGGSCGKFGPAVAARAVHVERAAREHDAAITHAHQLLVFDIVGESNRRVVREGLGFGADLQLAMHHDPLNVQCQIGVVGKTEFAADRHAIEGRRTDVEYHF